MPLTDRLLNSLTESAAGLRDDAPWVQALGLRSITLVGSLSRGDFVESDSDVDLLIVHSLGELPSADLSANPALRALAHTLGEPLLSLGQGTRRHQPFLLDCHFADASTIATQPQWADPGGFQREHLTRDRSLWLYAFDLVEHGQTLWGEPLALKPHEPAAYLPLLVGDLHVELARLQAHLPIEQLVAQRTRIGSIVGEPSVGAGVADARVSDALIADWKRLVGEVLTLLALKYGAHSLRRQDVFRCFHLSVPYFPGKDFAGHIWSEHQHGIVYDERGEWVRRCSRLCENGLKVLGSC